MNRWAIEDEYDALVKRHVGLYCDTPCEVQKQLADAVEREYDALDHRDPEFTEEPRGRSLYRCSKMLVK